MCVDYRKLNSVINFIAIRFIRLKKAVNAFASAFNFSSLDLIMGTIRFRLSPLAFKNCFYYACKSL